MVEISRRVVIQGSGAVGAMILPVDELCAHTSATKIATQEDGAHTQPPHPAPPSAGAQQHQTTYLFFNADEAALIEAAVARLIPKDDEWGGALEAGVPNYIDKQLAGAWGAGERLYRSGPWQPGTPS